MRKIRALRAILAASLLLAAVGVAPAAAATQTTVRAYVTTFHNNLQVSVAHPGTASCTGTSCSVTVATGKGDYNKFVKWCGRAYMDVTVLDISGGGSAGDCVYGNWMVQVLVDLLDENGQFISPTADVTVRVTVTP